MTLPIASSITSRSSDLPKSTINARTRSSFLEGRGTAFKSAKWFHSNWGCCSLTSLDIEIYDFYKYSGTSWVPALTIC